MLAQRMIVRSLIQSSLLCLGLSMTGEPALAQFSSTDRIYILNSGSELVDDCPICGRPTISVPLTGTFALRFVDQNPLVARYEIQNIAFQAGAATGREYTVAGGGTYQIGGEV